MDYYNWTDPVDLAFFVIPALLALALVAAVFVASRRLGEPPRTRRNVVMLTAAGVIVWMASTWVMAMQGTFRLWERTPPPFALLVLSILVLAAALPAGTYGHRLAAGVPLWVLVGIQGFRLPLELAMHEMYERGVMPVQMSYSGLNFDIVTGITALVVAALLRWGRAGRALVLAWNILGLALLLNIMTVAVLATPRIQYFGVRSVNFFVAYPPFVWLPAVMVLAALAGHFLIFRAVRAQIPR